MKHRLLAILLLGSTPLGAHAYADSLLGLERWRRPALYAMLPISIVLIALFIVLGRARSRNHEEEDD